MASIRRHIHVLREPDHVWDALRDVGGVHERLARGFVVDTTLEPGGRVVTFANGVVARERIVDVDDQHRRLAYSVVDGALGLTHHHASFEVIEASEGATLLVWITDVLPDDAAPAVAHMVELGTAAIIRTLTE